MKRLISTLLAATLFTLALASAGAQEGKVDLSKAAEKMGWQLGMQAYTFKDVTFVEACAKTKALGLKFIEFFPRQKFSNEPGQDFVTDDQTTPEQRALIKKALADNGLTAFAYGVVRIKPDAAFESVCAFGKEMGLQFIDVEPDNPQDGGALAKIAQKYGLRLAIHNHPMPSTYWNPESVFDVINNAGAAGAPQVFGSCCDTGHFVRSGLNPLACVEKLGKDNIFFFHFKDLGRVLTAEEIAEKTAAMTEKSKAPAAKKGGKGKGKKAGRKAQAAPAPAAKKAEEPKDVPWGTGVNDVWAVASMLKAWQWKGILGAEYEVWGSEQMDNLRQSYEFFNMVAAALDDEGWKPLFTDLAQAQQDKPGAWTVEGGVIAPANAADKKTGDVWTAEKYGDFILDLEFKCPQEKCNSGVFIRCTDTKQWLNSSMEIQILNRPEKNATHNTGAIYDVKGVAGNAVRPVGEWNRMTIIARRNMIYVMLNGHQVNQINLDQWTEAGRNPDGSKNKFKNAYKDMARAGVLGLQCHGDAVAFRNVKVKALD